MAKYSENLATCISTDYPTHPIVDKEEEEEENIKHMIETTGQTPIDLGDQNAGSQPPQDEYVKLESIADRLHQPVLEDDIRISQEQADFAQVLLTKYREIEQQIVEIEQLPNAEENQQQVIELLKQKIKILKVAMRAGVRLELVDLLDRDQELEA